MFGLKDSRPERASSIARVIYDEGYHGGNRSEDDKLTQPERLETEKCLLCGLPDSADHWLHKCSFRGLRVIRKAVLHTLQLQVTECRQQGALHRRLSYIFQSILHTTDEPSRIWTANWSRHQEAQLADCCDASLLASISATDLKGILRPLEETLAQGALNLWQCKVVNERSVEPTVQRKQPTTPALIGPEASGTPAEPGSTLVTQRTTVDVPRMSKTKRQRERIVI